MKHPRLHYGLGRGYVLARAPESGLILIGGLGGLQVGQMWQHETDDDQTREGYDDADIVDIVALLNGYGVAHPEGLA